MIDVREETASDLPGIRYVNEQAFGGPAEARLVDMLRASGKVVVSLAVGAVYDRAFGPLACESSAVIDRAYSKNDDVTSRVQGSSSLTPNQRTMVRDVGW